MSRLPWNKRKTIVFEGSGLQQGGGVSLARGKRRTKTGGADEIKWENGDAERYSNLIYRMAHDQNEVGDDAELKTLANRYGIPWEIPKSVTGRNLNDQGYREGETGESRSAVGVRSVEGDIQAMQDNVEKRENEGKPVSKGTTGVTNTGEILNRMGYLKGGGKRDYTSKALGTPGEATELALRDFKTPGTEEREVSKNVVPKVGDVCQVRNMDDFQGEADDANRPSFDVQVFAINGRGGDEQGKLQHDDSDDQKGAKVYEGTILKISDDKSGKYKPGSVLKFSPRHIRGIRGLKTVPQSKGNQAMKELELLGAAHVAQNSQDADLARDKISIEMLPEPETQASINLYKPAEPTGKKDLEEFIREEVLDGSNSFDDLIGAEGTGPKKWIALTISPDASSGAPRFWTVWASKEVHGRWVAIRIVSPTREQIDAKADEGVLANWSMALGTWKNKLRAFINGLPATTKGRTMMAIRPKSAIVWPTFNLGAHNAAVEERMSQVGPVAPKTPQEEIAKDME